MEFPKDRRSQVSPTANRVIISVNPNAGARSSENTVNELRLLLEAQERDILVTSNIHEVEEKASCWLEAEELRAVVAAGGDGTASLITSHTPAETPIAILPQGTENLLAKYLRIGTTPEQVADLIATGDTIQLDVGRANGRLFLIMLGCGFDAEVVRRMDENRQGHISHLDYAKPILQSIANYNYPDINIQTVDRDVSGSGPEIQENQAKWVFVINLPRYAGGLQIAPAANGTDEVLDLCAFREGSFLSGVTYLTGIITGLHEKWEDCITGRGQSFRLTSEEKVPFQIDGDPGGFLPVDVDVVPRRLRVFAPADFVKNYL